MSVELALVIYGRGDSLGNFKFFADDLVSTELSGFDKKNIIIKNIERKNDFFDFLVSHPFAAKIKELHIYSHAFGGGLSLGYGDTSFSFSRQALAGRSRGGSANYLSVLNNEVGTVFSDDLIRTPYLSYRTRIQSLFARDSKIKIWGCNSAIPGWEYSDTFGEAEIYDINAPADYYYWRALNELNMPKESVAQAFANYFQIKTFGATSGSSIQVKNRGKWQSSPSFLKQTGRKFVTEKDTLRLAPDKGIYNEYQPR
jgi:hypothetical protein